MSSISDLNIKLESPSKVLRKLTIVVPSKALMERTDRKLREVQKSAKLKGFRPGKAPISVIKQYYGGDVHNKVIHAVIDDSYRQALTENRLKPAGPPKVEKVGDDGKNGLEGNDLSFEVTLEVIPDVDVKTYTGFALKKKKIEVSEKEIEGLVEHIRNQFAQMVTITDDSTLIKKSTFADIVFKGGKVMEDGSIKELAGMAGSRLLEVGSNELIPGFEDNLIGLKKGESKTFRIEFPKDYGEKELAGKLAEFKVDVKELKEKIVPDLTDKLAQDSGYKDLADMRDRARKSITHQKTEESDKALRSELLENLIKKNKFDCPPALIDGQVKVLIDDFKKNLQQQQYPGEMIEKAVETEKANFLKKAENQVRAGLILDAVGKKEKIQVTARDIDDEIADMAKKMNMEVKKVNEFYTRQDQRENLEFRMLEDKTVEFILENSKIKEVS